VIFFFIGRGWKLKLHIDLEGKGLEVKITDLEGKGLEVKITYRLLKPPPVRNLIMVAKILFYVAL